MNKLKNKLFLECFLSLFFLIKKSCFVGKTIKAAYVLQ
ncbi:hypothetical protein P678_1623 [Acinetobacter baumannii UH7807]|uniref:Lipoprotein n=1 Tax=Acinetobacter baumannii UH5307 TaxID=1398973 RepID=A0ABC9V1X4_ACIBA|nr:hypothetical protein BJAB0868_01381 [Acinetobacter baumannii BJAB0868]EJG20707.1 hypothetical protein ACIN5189_A0263 [Acinetobacter baumannii OIFC189]EJG28460.1 hypothetical protein ACINNAV7_A3279 [Acinetobacter baumannii Naval-17]EKL57078.1 hypothetical protein ACIN5110_2247 [Acinetobacter baumannii OIFC110]EKP51257.1 hypothetical protein ACINNAV2_1400 [Acinetobacter baumannii Naval-2]ELW86370.1 hypothetical protein ACIN5021_1565 [Acinetobacter sp. OIFC021]ETP74350.1 hypothetical protein 